MLRDILHNRNAQHSRTPLKTIDQPVSNYSLQMDKPLEKQNNAFVL